MKQNVLVIGHADADGHIIAEQTRRNLSSVPNFRVHVVVDPLRTLNHKTWTKLENIPEIDPADLVFFVDMMFAPSSFAQEASSLVDFAQSRQEKQFFIVDHHPLPLRRLSEADNIRVLYRPSVFECVIGPRSGMMVVAALCEGQKSEVADKSAPIHDILALALRRAAAPGGNLCGKRLLALLGADCWGELRDLGTEDREFHYLPRGRRSANGPQSTVMKSLERIADEIIAGEEAHRPSKGNRRRESMSYDIDISHERFSVVEEGRRRVKNNANVHPRDLEAIITMLEVAALSLTSVPGAVFTRKQLIEEAQLLAGDELEIVEEDINIVLAKQGFLKRVGRELCLR